MRFEKDKTQAILIDAQEKLFPHMENHQILEQKINILIQGLNLLETPIIVSEQYKKGLGPTLESIEKNLSNPLYGEKTSFSVAEDQTLLKHIVTNQREQVIIFGIEAHICVLQSAIDLTNKGYSVCVVVDAIGSRSNENKEIALKRLEQEGVLLSSVESILFELCKDSKNGGFKSISSLIK